MNAWNECIATIETWGITPPDLQKPHRVPSTLASHSPKSRCTPISRRALSKSRRRCRPLNKASGAGAGPSTSTPCPAGAARPRSRATRSAAFSSGELTISAASRPKGGQEPGRRASASAAMKASYSPETKACITG